MLITPRRCPATSLLSCDFSNHERSAAAAQAVAAEFGDLADRIADSLQEQAAAGSPEEYQRLAADNQELTLVSSLSG
jgi:hypothetical protein